MKTKYLTSAEKIESLQEKVTMMRSKIINGAARNIQYSGIAKSLGRDIYMRMTYGDSFGTLSGNMENAADLISNDAWAFAMRKKTGNL